MKTISERQWRKFNHQLESIANSLRDLERKLPEKQKKYLNFNECVPPANVCKEVDSMMNGISTYEGFIGRLAEYYGCETMPCYVDTNVDPKYLAVYNPEKKIAYSRQTIVSKSTILHEFFHHLINLNVVVVSANQHEHYANKYAEVFMQRIQS